MKQTWHEFPFGFDEAQRQLDADMAAYAARHDDPEDAPARDQPAHRLLGVKLAEQCACVLDRQTGQLITPCTGHGDPHAGSLFG